MGATDRVKRILVGRKLASTQLGDTLLPKRIALPIFASDALSSVAYAPDEVLLTLSLAGMSGFVFAIPIGVAVGCVLLVVVASYRQTVHAYPSGGGDYEVVTKNLGPGAGLVVASSLLVDYVLTVAVSVSSGVQNAEAMLPWMAGHEGVVAAVVIVLLMSINLRGVRDSGGIFAVPTYLFMLGVGVMIVWGLVRILVLHQGVRAETAGYLVVGTGPHEPLAGLGMVVLLARAFSSGCAALTGVEAISNGVPNFRSPKSRNAATTLLLLGTIAISMLMGILVMVRLTGAKMIDPRSGSYFVAPDGTRVRSGATTVMGQLARAVFYPGFGVGFYFLITMTVIILFLAANTAFNGFPTLGSILSRDGWLPRQLHQRGDRLAYSNGIMTLAAGAAVLVLVFNASVTMLIQMYVVGVFISFTLSQISMIIHWTRHLGAETDPAARRRMRRSRAINTIGAVMTGIVLVIVLASKFIHGAWMALLAMAVVYVLMHAINRHYGTVYEEISDIDESDLALPSRVHALVMVNAVTKPAVKAIQFAKATRPSQLEALTVAIDPAETGRFQEAWEAEDLGVPLKIVASPYRQVTGPFIDYVRRITSDNPRDIVCVYIPEFVVGHWWEQMLHNQTALIIRAHLHFMKGVMVTSVPYQIRSGRELAERRRQARLEREAAGARPLRGAAS
ncbi:APC family permease [uncultured Propionibacterium sp.]|uniref:APC family permease n=1 Tax=uncultured Propionibacterium sp. TaxID=218066 RepID=UPI00292FBAC5|nr:APC family permease [uncultured Propionibacterium sp.]